MDRYAQEIRERLDRESKYRNNLFCRGYLITDAKLDSIESYPFYGGWREVSAGEYTAYVHPEATAYSRVKNGRNALLIGHAYDPVTGDINEEKILDRILDAEGKEEVCSIIDSLTGIFVFLLFEGKSFSAVQDCSGQKMMYFGKAGDRVVLTSIPQLAGDVFDLHWNSDVERLVRTKGYLRGSGFLPGNLSPYSELTRLGANTELSFDGKVFKIRRIYPLKPRTECKTEEEKTQTIEEMYGLFSGSIALAVKKWKRAGLSLTGGMDSKTTFACAKEAYGDIFVYSFSSKPSEKLDADAAKLICDSIGVKHHLYVIPEEPTEIEDYDFLRSVIEHNTSHICKLHPNEIRKYVYLRDRNDFDVEIKSDVSEIGRAYTSRKYYKVKMPRVLAPRHFTIGQGRYFFEPWAVKFADRQYAAFMNETGLTDDILGYSMHDLGYWEVRTSAWAATSLASQEYFHEITVPYNNRKLMDLFLRFPVEDRLNDIPHKMLMRRGNPAAADLEYSVKDSYFGKKRMLLETVYYYYATRMNTLGKK